jgi:Lrp/AsnC family transcriptional regulator, leucine-responsive regulatory protein
MNLDATDIRILKVLQSNGRLSFRQIAEKVKVSVPTVSSKINSIESMGVIKGYQAELDSEKLGGISVVLDIKTRPADIRKVSERFASDEHVRKAYVLSNSRLLIVVTFTQQHLINEFVMNLSDIPEIVEYELTNIITVLKEQQRAVINPEVNVVLTCAYCNKEIRDDAFKVKEGDKEYYVCCPVCQKNLEQKIDSLKSKA